MNKTFRVYTVYTVIFFTAIVILLSAGIFFYSRPLLSQTMDRAFICILAEISLSFLFILVFRSIFLKTSSPEVFFIIIALGGVSFESFRTVVYLTHRFSSLYALYTFLPRAVYFGKLLTALTLFVSGLFSTGFQLQKQAPLFGLALLFAFLLSTTVPIDFSVSDVILLPGSRSPYIMQNILYSFYLLAFINYLTGALINKNPGFALTGLGLALFSAGIELVFPLHTGVYMYTGFGLFTSGLILAAYEINRIYSWM